MHSMALNYYRLKIRALAWLLKMDAQETKELLDTTRHELI